LKQGVDSIEQTSGGFMGDVLYRIIAGGLQSFIWGGELQGEENLPERGPAILVANHLGSLGPIAVVASTPLRLYPWVAADMMDPKLAAEYLRWDFVEKDLGLPQPISLWVAKALSKVTVPLLRIAGGIPVYSDADRVHLTFEHSLNLLLHDRLLLVFPEDPARALDPRFNMRPFKKGFIRLVEMYFQKTSRALSFYPLAVHAEQNVVQAGKPIRYNPYASPVRERLRIRSVIETMIHNLYLDLGGSSFAGVPLPH
jgi:hypothetical protein